MSSTSRAWIVAASVGAVEALRSLNQHAKNNLGSLSQATRLPSPSFAVGMTRKVVSSDKKMQQSEESLRKVCKRPQVAGLEASLCFAACRMARRPQVIGLMTRHLFGACR
ncbi:hypothetical protein NE237_033116 [Protea cynaroides]|uniref:Uncharacterized protein n=1 Tax=Protea cynaroides TaxID=273540 RepID=A0A9Q0L4L9_9MAGN|nr:hypothetical protein NE237_033116 [Protea cynaroides]